MNYRYTDAGRRKGLKGKLKGEDNDCSVQAIKHAFDLRYWQAHWFLKWHGRKDKTGFNVTSVLDPMYYLGVTMNNRYPSECKKFRGKGVTVKEFVKSHKKGVWIVYVREHVFCVKNGVVYDRINSLEQNYAVLYAYKIVKER